MIITDKFIFLHFPKTWWEFVANFIEKFLWPIVYRWQKHDSILNIPEIYNNRLIFWFIRNPWDWYYSWYFYHKNLKKNERNPLLSFCSNNFELDINQTIKRLLNPW